MGCLSHLEMLRFLSGGATVVDIVTVISIAAAPISFVMGSSFGLKYTSVPNAPELSLSGGLASCGLGLG